jgi:hypothetical protein
MDLQRKIKVASKKTPSKEDLRQLGGDAEEGGAAGWEAPCRRGSEAAVVMRLVLLLSCRGVTLLLFVVLLLLVVAVVVFPSKNEH